MNNTQFENDYQHKDRNGTIQEGLEDEKKIIEQEMQLPK